MPQCATKKKKKTQKKNSKKLKPCHTFQAKESCEKPGFEERVDEKARRESQNRESKQRERDRETRERDRERDRRSGVVRQRGSLLCLFDIPVIIIYDPNFT